MNTLINFNNIIINHKLKKIGSSGSLSSNFTHSKLLKHNKYVASRKINSPVVLYSTVIIGADNKLTAVMVIFITCLTTCSGIYSFRENDGFPSHIFGIGVCAMVMGPGLC